MRDSDVDILDASWTASTDLYVAQARATRAGAAPKDVRRNFSTVRLRVWQADAGPQPPCTCSAPACCNFNPPIRHRTTAHRRDAIFQLIRPSIPDVKLRSA